MLSKLTTLPMAVGDTVHRLARHCVRRAVSGQPGPSVDHLLQRGRRTLNDLIHCSRTQQKEFAARPNAVPMLAEIFYDGVLCPDSVLQAKAALTASLVGLTRCEVFDELRETNPQDVRPIEALESFLLDDIVVYGAPDLAYAGRVPEHPIWTVVDWKTGRFDGATDQLAVYALLLKEALCLPPHPTHGYRATVAALGAGGLTTTVNLGIADIQDARDRIRRSAGMMRSYVADSAINRPQPLAAFQARPGRRCSTCVFRGMCPEAAPQGLHERVPADSA